MNNYKPIIQNFGVMNQHLISRYLDYGALDNLPVLQNVDTKLQKLWAECKAEIPAQYIWRTRGDDKVRGSHAANNGKVFSRDNPPPTGNPGDEFGCRCWAEEYVAGKSEFAYQEVISAIGDSSNKWKEIDFIKHFYLGFGRGIYLSQTGHLRGVIDYYFYNLNKYNHINSQIIDEARNHSGKFGYYFTSSNSFDGYLSVFGSSIVSGLFSGSVEHKNGIMYISGDVEYFYEDIFTDIASIREKVIRGTSNPDDAFWLELWITDAFGFDYLIRDNWQTKFVAEAKLDRSDSIYQWNN